MSNSRRVPLSSVLVLDTKPLIGALAAALLMCSSAHAASFGHSRIVSGLGQPLRIDVPIHQLSPDELRSLSVAPAPASAWTQAGLIPPVDLASLRLDLVDGYAPGTKVVQLRSTTTFDKPVADILLDVRTSSGQQRYQVSLLAQSTGTPESVQRSSDRRSASDTGQSAHAITQRKIRVRRGDTMFAIARRNAVQGVTIYQMMMALQRANPRAFILDNVNLVKAGATLTMPDRDALTAISDREARRLFMQQAHAFALYRQRAATDPALAEQLRGGASGVVGGTTEATVPARLPAPEDQLRLSGNPPASTSSASSAASAFGNANPSSPGTQSGAGSQQDLADVQSDDRVAAKKDVQESERRVSQLEENVKHLNEALQSQGAAAADFLVEGARSLAGSPGETGKGVEQKGDGIVPQQSGRASNSGASADVASPTIAAGSSASPAALQPNADSLPADGAGTPDGGRGARDASESPLASAEQNAALQGNGSEDGTKAPPVSGSANASGTAPDAAAVAGSSSQAAGNDTASGQPSAAGDVAQGSAEASGAQAADPAQASGALATRAGDASNPPGAKDNANAPSGVGTDRDARGNAGAAQPATTSSLSKQPESNAGPSSASRQVSSEGSGTRAAGAAPALAKESPAPGAETPNSTTNNGVASNSQASGDAEQAISSKAEQTVSWLQEHMLGVITGVLAFIVLIIAWLLRRANSARGDGRDDSAGVVTEAMVKEKLDQINLDLEQQPRTRKS